MTQEYDTTTERKLWFSGAWGRSLPTSFLQFGPDCIACHYYPEFGITTIIAEGLRIVYNNEATSKKPASKKLSLMLRFS